MSTQGKPPRQAPRTPYEMVFVTGGFEPRLDDIRTEAVARGSDTGDPEQLMMLGEAGRLIRELVPEDADPASVLDVGRLIFHAFHFRAAGLSTYLLEPSALRPLLAEAPADPAGTQGTPASPPAAAGYLQLPRNALWARLAEDANWEAVDGVFWTTAFSSGDGSATPVHALAVLGIRPDRPGFSVVAVDAETPPEEGDWSRVQARAEGEDFANLLPGGELSDLHTLLNGAEVLKLLARFFQFVAAHPEAVEAEPGVAAATGASTVSPARRFRVQSWPDGR